MVHADIWFDGASRGNPGPMAGAAVAVIDGRRFVVYGPVGHGTNNEAEYQGLIVGLRAALEQGARTVAVHGDTQLVLRQLEGRYKVRADNLRPLWEEASMLLRRFGDVRLTWVRRAENAAADAAANEALDRVRRT